MELQLLYSVFNEYEHFSSPTNTFRPFKKDICLFTMTFFLRLEGPIDFSSCGEGMIRFLA